jgi:hypothetical protein
MRTETWSNYQERLIWEEASGARIIPFPHRYKTPEVHEIQAIKDIVG